ncbi:hypothetical protein ACF0H5_007075 [Mactra antiquata]
MTTRTAYPRNRPVHGETNQQNSNAYINDLATTQPRDQSVTRADNKASTKLDENKTDNSPRKPVYFDNHSALFDTYYYEFPATTRTEKPKPETKNVAEEKRAESSTREPVNNRNDSYTAVQRDTNKANAKVVSVGVKADELDSDYRGVPTRVGEVEAEMASSGYKVDELELRSKLHSAKIFELERELKNVRNENNHLKGQYGSQSPRHNPQQFGQQNGSYGQPRNDDHYSDPYSDPYQQQHANQGYPGVKEMHQRNVGNAAEEPRGKRVYANEQHNVLHHAQEVDGVPYWGMNKYYDPQYSTAYRREHVPYLAMREQKDKPRTYDYTAPYQAMFPPRDINKYFHDSKYLDDENTKPEPKPDEYYFGTQEFAPPFKNPGTGLSTYELAYIPPGHSKKTQQIPGGLYIMRFHSSGTEEVEIALKQQQTIIKSFSGHVLGVSGKDQVVVLEGDADWRYGKGPSRNVADSIALMWFPSRDKAFDFYSNSFRNKFKQQGFPTPHGWECHYIPMRTPVMFRALNTYLVVELLNGAKHSKDKIDYFEQSAKQTIHDVNPNSMPMVATAARDVESFRPGPLFKARSAVFISRFGSIREACDAWQSGKSINSFDAFLIHENF